MLVIRTKRPIEESVPGIISVVNWIMAPDGHKYLFFWAKRWQIITDKEIPVEGFHSSERWQLVAVSSNSDVLAVFPGCQVKAWIRSDQPPPLDCYSFEEE